MISYILRLASPVEPLSRLREVVRQLSGIGGGRSLGFGPNRVRSLPDGVGQVIEMYLREKDGLSETSARRKPARTAASTASKPRRIHPQDRRPVPRVRRGRRGERGGLPQVLCVRVL
jgi:hypothetical protein